MRTTWCSVDCAITIARDNQSKARAKSAANLAKKEITATKANRKALRELNRKDRRWQHKKTQIAFNRMRVLEEMEWFAERQIEPYCISCQKTHQGWCCGHYVPVASCGSLRYDRQNTYLQCNVSCNMALSGNLREYTKGILSRFGEKRGSQVIDYCETHRGVASWSWQDIEDLRFSFLAKIKALQQNKRNSIL